VNVVKKPSTPHGRVLAVWSLVFGGWMIAMVVTQFGISWSAGLAGFVLSVTCTGGVALLARAIFRRIAAAPVSQKSVDVWFARRPWLAAAISGGVFLAVPGATLGGEAFLFRRIEIPAGFWWTAGAWAIFAVGAAAFSLLVHGQQRQQSSP
jgi:hypothetical protein